ncbi:MAG: DNA-binding response regulator [Candidatus Sedimenticola endophacoides]|uniref:DNA-binding response regulator n=1 Tax=Candidatus Sedimenticola endophacoides TaxID=2548426 RepID=A0A6N4DYI7_9GAMM|nr:MAG: DNA-binding response regulator [Candidatus Sedimenticola endophacoides]PUE03311.1 MAG: DNA-binding response regulator [Candidatus Sedimenticola endophacoides]PUE05124.1 MAG: DNA-binding response regulator [Candidatus Sedimenticola endophacoides]
MALDKDKSIILVVDDSPDSIGMINTTLNQAGYTVLVSLNGQQALHIVNQVRPRVVLMDAVMPVMDGFECTREMRRQLPLTPIIFMTGLTDAEHTVKAFEHGGTDYITKPINPGELLARIKSHVNNANMITHARTALDLAKQYILAVNNSGTILWATPETRKLLADQYVEPLSETLRLAPAIREWLKRAELTADLVVQSDWKPISLRYVKSVHSDEHLLRIVGQDVLLDASVLEASLPVTKREAVVLMWVARGKTNREIGAILDLSPRTINKHLEQVYTKIQVDNRAAATSIAIQAMLGMAV